MFSKVATKIFGSRNQRLLRKLSTLADKINALHRANIEIRALKIKVRPRHASPRPATSEDENAGRSLDSKTAGLLAQTADGLKSQDLAQAVKRLSRHGHRESD